MGFYRGPNIVRDGLILALDAASPRSYPGSGTTWFDLSGNGNNHTIVNSPTYSNSSFTLNETQGFSIGSMPTTSTTCTVVIFYKTTDTQELWVKGQTTSYYLSASYGNNYYHSNAGSPTNYVDTIQRVNPSLYRDGTYHMWEAKNVNFSTWTQMNWFLYGTSWNMNGTVAKIMLYNRTITAEESTQNYNAFKSRFGL